MSDPQYVYWRRKEGIEAPYVAGTCPEDQVPGYGEMDDLALPREITRETSVLPDGRVKTELTTPPVFGPKYAYRFHTILLVSNKEDLQKASLSDLRQKMHAQKTDAPYRNASRENWWWANHDRRWRYCETPLRLAKTWTGPMLAAMTEGLAGREAILTEWQEDLQRHKDYVARTSSPAHKARKKYGVKKNGTLVLARDPIAFQSGSFRQLFVLRPFGRRDQLGPHSPNGVRYKVPARSMQPVCDAWIEDAEIPSPIAYAAHLARLSRDFAGATSSHAQMAFASHIRKLRQGVGSDALAWLTEIEKETATVSKISLDLAGKHQTLLVAHGILSDFLGNRAGLTGMLAETAAPAIEYLQAALVRAIEARLDLEARIKRQKETSIPEGQTADCNRT